MGRFIISDINVFADKETGFSPNYVRIAKRIPTEHMNTPLTFKFQYFDTRGLKADLETFAYGAVFDGDNVYIEGTDNLLTGSVFIGNSIGSGIELAGVSSGFIRSIGYDGFTNTAAGTTPGGFLIYSGSNNLTLGADTYQGVGLQLVGDNDSSHFIFTTQAGGSVDIKAEKFFIGTTGTQFISGSDGNIEISSSIFHLDPQENKLIIGADAIINADLSVNQLFTPAGTNKSNARSYISSSGEAGFSGDGEGKYAVLLDGDGTSEIAGFTIDSAAIKSSDGSSLVLKDTGEITGSKVLLSGGRITGGVVIEGSVTANQIRTPATIAGQPSTQANASSSIDQLGFAKFASASIAGFVVNTEEIKSPLDGNIHNLRLKASGQVTGSKVQFDGGTIGGFQLSSTQINSTTNDLILKASGEVTGSKALFTGGKIGGFTMTAAQLSGGSGTDFIGLVPGTGIQMGNETFSSAPFSVTKAGVLKATSGTIGGFTLGTNTLTATNFILNPAAKRITLGTGNNIFIADGDEGIQLGHASFASAPFSVDLAGRIKATEGEIGGFGISSTKITGSNIVIDSAGSIQTSDYASDLKGWKISADFNGFAEFENAKIRGTLSTAVFEKETVNAVGGQLYVANSTALTASVANPSGNYTKLDATMSVVNVSGFSQDEILSLKKVSNTGFSTEYVKVISASRNDPGSDTNLSGELFLTRSYGSSFPIGVSGSLGDTPGGAQSYSGSQVIVSTGKIGTGYIRLNANPNDQATPYMDIVERTGSGVYDVDLKVRLGDLKGLANSKYVFGSSTPGFGLATTNVFLQGGIIANTGSIAGINMEAGKLFTGAGVYFSAQTGFYVDSGSNFSLGNKLKWVPGDGVLTVIGDLRLSEDQTVSNAIATEVAGAVTASAFGVDLSTVNTAGGLNAGLLMTSNVMGFHGAISAGDGTNAVLSDFTSLLDNGGNFYLGGNASGATSGNGFFSWNNSTKELLITGSKARVEVDKFFLGSAQTQFISGSNGNITISGDVDFQGLPRAGNVVFFEDWSAFQNNSNTIVNQSDAPKTDGTGIGFFPYINTGIADTAVKTDYAGQFQGNYLQVGSNNGSDYVWASSNQLIPFNETSLYEVEIRVKVPQATGNPLFYAGFTGYRKDGVTKSNVNGADSFSSVLYIAASGETKAELTDWKIMKGYLQGTASSGAGGEARDITNPAKAHSNNMNGYLAPVFIAGLSNQTATTLIDYIRVTEINNGGGSTRISGDSIKAGTIKSNNLSNFLGTELALDDGVFRIGGTGAYTSYNGILMEGAHARIAIGKSDGQFLRFNHTAGKLEVSSSNFSINSSGNVVVSGDITVSNPEDFASGQSFAYDFTGNGSQTLDTGVWTLANTKQDATTTGMQFGQNAGSTNWNGGIITNVGLTKADGLTLIMDFDVINTNTSGYSMYGFWTPTQGNGSYTYGAAMFYSQGANLHFYYRNASNTMTNFAIVNGGLVIGDSWRFKLKAKTNGQFEYAAYKNGNFTAPTYSGIVSGNATYTVLHLGASWYGASGANGYSNFKFKSWAVNGQPGTTTISGTGISTGAIQSTNLAATRGTKIDLDNETAQFGGTDVSYTAGTGVFLDGGSAGSPKVKIGSTTQFLKFDTTAGLQVAGDITVTNAGDFANPNASATLNYNFAGNGSQTLDTGIWTVQNIASQIASTNGIRLNRASGNDWNGGIRTILEYPRSESPVLIFDWEQMGNASSGGIGYTMVGWWTGAATTYSSRLYYGIYIYNTSIAVRTAVSAGGSVATPITNNSIGTKWRLKIRLKSGGGAMLELFRNGDFITPAGTYDFGTTGTLANLAFGMVQYRPGNSDIKLEQVAIGSQPATTTISGNGISTGLLESTNVSATAGSRFNLDDGQLFLGGTGTGAKLKFTGGNLTLAGTVTATAGAIGGTTINSTELRSTSNMPAPDSQAKFKLANSGAISGSSLFIRQVANLGSGNERIDLINTQIGLIDGRNMGRQVVTNYDLFTRSNVNDSSTFVTINQHYFHLLPYENSLSITFQMKVGTDNNGNRGSVQFLLQYMSHEGSDTTGGEFNAFSSYSGNAASVSLQRTTSGTTSHQANGSGTKTITIPIAAQAKACRLLVQINNRRLSSGAVSPNKFTSLQGYAVTACRKLVAETAGNADLEDLASTQ